MSLIKQIISLLENHHKKGKTLSKTEVLSILESVKDVTEHKKTISSLIFFFSTLKDDNNLKLNTLTTREEQVLYYVGNGEKSSAIASILKLSTSTIETHRKNIIKKLQLVGKGKLIEYAILNNLQQRTHLSKSDDEKLKLYDA
jgi:two-component system nitrate/nitrite response regulator NarL|nr:helix-turn-helix transcriptional regulator [uncultured Psychroserpens sp.]